MEPQQAGVAALAREIREETGLALENVELYRIRTLKRHVEILYRATAVGDASVRSREITELGWFEPDKVPEEMNPAQRSLIRKVFPADV